MNSQHVADLGLKRGDYIYLRSNRGWSGFYQITDSGCAYGTIDIYIDYAYLPHWGVERGVQILYGPELTFDPTLVIPEEEDDEDAEVEDKEIGDQ